MTDHAAAIEHARSQKLLLEQNLADEIQRLVHRFQESVGLAVNGITVDMLDVTTFGDESKRHRISVRCDVGL